MLYYDLLFDNPSGLWPLDTSTGTVFSDMSGYDQDANSSVPDTDVEFVEPVAAQGGSAVRIRTTHTMTLPLNGILQVGKESKPATLEFWIKNENLTGTFTFGGVTIVGSDVTWSLGGDSISEKNAVDVGTPHHIVAIYDITSMKLYVDGMLVGTTLISSADFTGLNTGTIVASSSAGRVVALDQVATYNYTLSDAQIADHYRKGSDYLSVANNDAGLDSIRIEFDDIHLPVVYRSEDEYGPVMAGLMVRDGQIEQLWNDETQVYDAGTYTHLVQFDNQVYGMALPARVDWNVIGDASRVTVESSKDNATWAAVTNHGMTTNWDDLMDGNDYFLRFNISAGTEPVSVDGLTVTMYKEYVYTSSDVNVKATVVNNSNVNTGLWQTKVGAFINRDSLDLNPGSGGLKIDTHVDFGNIASVEMLLKPFTGVGTYLSNGASRLWRDGTGLHWTGFDRIIVNGEEAVDGDTGTVGWKHIVAVFSTSNNNLNYIGAKSDASDEANFQVGFVALHRSKLTTAQAKRLYDTYVGAPPIRITDVNQMNIAEHLQDNGEYYKVYAFDWAVSGAMGT